MPYRLTVILVLMPVLAHADSAIQAWIQRYGGPAAPPANMDIAYAVAVDCSNNVVITGSSFGSGTYSDFATIKYSSTGLPLWTNRYNGPVSGSDAALSLALDSANNVIVTGPSDAGAAGSMDYLTIKYSNDGVPLWTNRYNGPLGGGDRPRAVVVDASNNVVVTGYSPGTENGTDYATIKYSSDGEPLWINRFTGSGTFSDLAVAMAVDGNNDVLVTGHSFSSSLMTSSDFSTVKYSSDGVPLWTNVYNGPGNSIDIPTALVVDRENSVIVTGESGGNQGYEFATIKYSRDGVPVWTNRYPSGSPYALTVDRSNNVIVAGTSGIFLTIKYSSDGVPLWTNRYTGPDAATGQVVALAADPADNIIVTGYAAATNTYPYVYDFVTIKYSAAGEALWTNRYNGPANGDDEPCALALDHEENIIVTGYLTGAGGTVDYATIKYVSVPYPVLTALAFTNGTFSMRVDALLRPGTQVIEASTNLRAWSPVFTNTNPTNMLFYTDPNAGGRPPRFYRAFQYP